jgi:hypothetical protein
MIRSIGAIIAGYLRSKVSLAIVFATSGQES